VRSPIPPEAVGVERIDDESCARSETSSSAGSTREN
jgi:hypothetical protein